MTIRTKSISVVTPTLQRPDEVVALLKNLSAQVLLPEEVIIVDGALDDDQRTRIAVLELKEKFPFKITYLRHGGGTAIQRNVGIDAAQSDYVALIDDDVRLEKDFLNNIIEVFSGDAEMKIGGIVGYRKNRQFKLTDHQRWLWYKRLRLLTVFEPGRYDFLSGYPINNNMQEPFTGTRGVDFMTTACAVWRRQVFDTGLRFHPFFADYGVLEDAHFSLNAGREWKLLQCGDAHCMELHSPHGRVDQRKIGYKCVVNYYFVFRDIAGPLSVVQKMRFWRFQAFELLRMASSALRRRKISDAANVYGRICGIFAVMLGAAGSRSVSKLPGKSNSTLKEGQDAA